MGRDPRLWPMLSSLLIVVLVPTAGLLWFMSRAIENERLAVRQILAEACRGQLVRLRGHWDEHWQARTAQLDAVAAENSPQGAFAAILRQRLADSAVCCDDRGRPTYPVPPSPPTEETIDEAAWVSAGELEHVAQKPREAAQAYAAIAKGASNANVVARALLAEARCIARAGQGDEAIDILANTLAEERFRRAVDGEGRLIVADAELRSLELLGDRSAPRFQELAERLAKRLCDYSNPLLGSSQRRFLMKSLGQLAGETVRLPTLDGEELAAAFLESGAGLSGKSVLLPTGMTGVWQFSSAEGPNASPLPLGEGAGVRAAAVVSRNMSEQRDTRPHPNPLPAGEGTKQVVALFRTETLSGEFQSLVANEGLPPGVSIELLPPEPTPASEPAGFLDVLPVGARQPGWQLALARNDEELVNATAQGKIAAYVLTGILAIVAASLLALWIALALGRQMRLARLKNDLVATVSHELKTPLTSIRVLVDTLLAAAEPDRQRDREYLELVAKENTRLGRLIDNFLTFSRMERNKRAFDFREVEPAAIVAAAAEAVDERFQQAGCRFEVQVRTDLPPIAADPDAMVTALANLLDNACKYTDDDKRIALRASCDRGQVCFEVSDNGIGLSRAACKKVFQRFYQVDRELSRSRGGCGLGLSIVEFIVQGHGGSVSVRSQPNKGSTFTIAVPCCGKPSMERSAIP